MNQVVFELLYTLDKNGHGFSNRKDHEVKITLFEDLPEAVLDLKAKGIGYLTGTIFDRNTFGCGTQTFSVRDIERVKEAVESAYNYLSSDSDGVFSGVFDEDQWADIGGMFIWSLLTRSHDSLSSNLHRLHNFDYKYEVYKSYEELDAMHDGDSFKNYIDGEFEIVSDCHEVLLLKV